MQKHRHSIIALGLVLLVYAAAFALVPKQVFWSPDEGIKYIMLRTFRWDGGLKYIIPYQGARLDPEFKFYPSRNPFRFTDDLYPYTLPNGATYFPWPIWFPLMAWFFYLVLGTNGSYLVPLLSGWLVCVVVWQVMDRLRPALAPAAILLAGLGTPVFFYSQTFWEHTLATLMVLVVFRLLMKNQSRDLLPLVLLSPLVIVSVILRLEMIVFALALLLALVLSRFFVPTQPETARTRSESTISLIMQRRPLRWMLYLVPLTCDGILLSNLRSLMSSRHPSNIATFTRVVAENSAQFPSSPSVIGRYIANLPSVIINYTAGDGPAVDRIWLWVGLIAFASCILSAFITQPRLQAGLLISSLLVVLILSTDVLWSQQYYRSLHGILLVAPYTALAAYPLASAWRRREFNLLFVSLATCIYLAFGVAMILATRVDSEGDLATGLEWGQRYLLPLYPLSAILALVAVQTHRDSDSPRLARYVIVAIAVLMLLASVQYQVRGLWLLYLNKQSIAGWQRALELHEQEPVVTDLWWLPASLAEYYVSHEIYVVHPDDASEWLELAAAHNAKAFTYVSQTGFDAKLFQTSQIPLSTESQNVISGLYLTRLRIDLPTQ